MEPGDWWWRVWGALRGDGSWEGKLPRGMDGRRQSVEVTKKRRWDVRPMTAERALLNSANSDGIQRRRKGLAEMGRSGEPGQ